MPSAAYYRAKARECLALAEQATTEEMAKSLRKMARDNFALAEMLGPDAATVEDDKPKESDLDD
jgi:hypothetical protein